MENERIKLNDSVMDIVVKMSDGNPGAATVICELLITKIDSDMGLGGLGTILLLDSYGIYGTDIYILHNDICDRDLAKTMAVMRAAQFGYLDKNTLKDACHRQDRSGKALIPVDELYSKVKERLPNFNKETTDEN